MGGGVLSEQVVKQPLVVQILRNGDLQQPLAGVLLAEAQRRQRHQRGGDDHEGQSRQPYVSHSGGKADGHAQKQHADLPGRTGRGAETHQAEGACHRDACADVAVYQHDDHLHHHGQDGQRHGKALGGAGAELGHEGKADAQHQRRGGTDKKRGQG